MVFFGRKRYDDEEEDLRDRSLSKTNSSFDRAEASRRKKKELPKQWTKKERYLVFYILLITVVLSGFLALSAREWKLPGLPRLALPKIKFFEGEKIVIEKGEKTLAPELRNKSEKIIQEFGKETEDLSGVYGLYVLDLKSDYSFGVFEDEIFQAASLIKLPVMAGMYIEMENGKWKMEDRYALKNIDKASGAGSLYKKPEGYELAYKDLVRLMGKESDNTAFRIAKDLLGEDRVKEIIKEIGMAKTDFAKNETTPKDIGLFFKKLYQAEIVNDKNKEDFLANLTNTLYEEWLAAGVPDDIRVAHKFGREMHVVNDAGIVFTEKPYIVVIMGKGVIEREADEIFPRLSKLVYDDLNSGF